VVKIHFLRFQLFIKSISKLLLKLLLKFMINLKLIWMILSNLLLVRKGRKVRLSCSWWRVINRMRKSNIFNIFILEFHCISILG